MENTVQVVKNILANVSASCEDLVPSEYRQRGALLNTREHRPLYDDLLKAEDPNGQVTTKLTECVGYTPIDPSSSTPCLRRPRPCLRRPRPCLRRTEIRWTFGENTHKADVEYNEYGECICIVAESWQILCG